MTTHAPLFDRAKLKAGDAIFVGRGNEELPAMVTKVARKYFTASYVTGYGHRYADEFEFADGTPRGRCIYRAWPSPEARNTFNSAKAEEYEQIKEFEQLRRECPYRKPDGMTRADIAEVRRLLKLPEAK
jgi:hypothetical protein